MEIDSFSKSEIESSLNRIDAILGENILSIKCNDQEKTIRFHVIQSRNCQTMGKEINQETKEIFLKQGFKEEDIENAKQTEAVIEHKLEYGVLFSSSTELNISRPS